LNCLICLKPITGGKFTQYHGGCLDRMFGSRKLNLELAESRSDLVRAMPRQTHGFSISGVQMKAQMAVQSGRLQLVDNGGQFIVKPSPEEYPFVAENEHATLTLMSKVGFPVPHCGLIKLKDGHLVFAIRRYDRDLEEGGKLHQEDAMQALGISNSDSSNKYTAASYQTVLEMVNTNAGAAVAMELLERLVFSYLVGNDDHHLKNISFLHEPLFKLTPGYDVLASSLYSSRADSPMALKMLSDGEPEYYGTMGNGYYSGSDFVELGTKAGLREATARKRVAGVANRVEKFAPDILEASFMPDDMKARYQDLVVDRLRFVRELKAHSSLTNFIR